MHLFLMILKYEESLSNDNDDDLLLQKNIRLQGRESKPISALRTLKQSLSLNLFQ